MSDPAFASLADVQLPKGLEFDENDDEEGEGGAEGYDEAAAADASAFDFIDPENDPYITHQVKLF